MVDLGRRSTMRMFLGRRGLVAGSAYGMACLGHSLSGPLKGRMKPFDGCALCGSDDRCNKSLDRMSHV
jgi:hypothetical protein